MNGWGDPEPAWWLNLQAQADATVQTKAGTFAVRAHAAAGSERERLWRQWQEYNDNLDGYAALRSRQTAVVVFEPIL